MNNYEYQDVEGIEKNAKYPFTRGQLRHMLLRRHKNGLDNVVRKVGRRLYFRMDLFEEWIENQNVKGR